jgi:hypothetical protein
MSIKVSRRDALQFVGLGALALGHSALLAGCADRPRKGLVGAYTLDPGADLVGAAAVRTRIGGEEAYPLHRGV